MFYQNLIPKEHLITLLFFNKNFNTLQKCIEPITMYVVIKKNYASAEIRQWSRVLKNIKRCLHDLILIDVYALERSSCFHTTDFYKHKNNKFGFRPQSTQKNDTWLKTFIISCLKNTCPFVPRINNVGYGGNNSYTDE